MKYDSKRLQRFSLPQYKKDQQFDFKYSKTDFLATVTCDAPFKSLYEVIEDNRCVQLFILQGIAGTGKTYLMLRALNDLISAKENAIFISVIKLSIYEDDGAICMNPVAKFLSKNVFCDNIKCNLNHDEFNGLVDFLNKKNRLILLIDGLNETKNDKSKIILDEISRLAKFKDNLRVIVSSRSNMDIFSYINNMEKKKITIDKLDDPIITKFIENQKLNLPEPNAEMKVLLKTALMLVLYSNTSAYEDDFRYDGCKIKPFYKEPLESLAIWNFFHIEVAKVFKNDRDATTIEPLRKLIALEWILPDIAYNMMVNDVIKDLSYEVLKETYFKTAINRLNEQLKIYYKRNHNLPSRMMDLFGDIHLKTEEKELNNFNIQVIDSNLEMDIFLDVCNALNNDDEIGDETATKENDKRLFGFFHICLRNCMAALHLINSIKMPDLLISGFQPEVYVSKLWIKHKFEDYQDMLSHFAQLEKRKSGFRRLMKLKENLYQASVYGNLIENNGCRIHNMGVLENHRYNYYMDNVFSVSKEFLRLFKDTEEYISFFNLQDDSAKDSGGGSSN